MSGRPPRARRLTWVEQVRTGGQEPDPRFSFANERTFLAWIRTSLAFLAAGIGVDAFATDLPDGGRTTLAAGLVVMAGLLAASAFRRWLRAEVTLRHSKPLPTNRLAPTISYGVSVGALFCLVLVLAGR